jgi:diguanylate cyclase (GGDEF)-like protein
MPAPLPDPRIELLVEHVVRLASGDLSARLAPSPARDDVDAMIVGMNMLAEELQALSTAFEARVAERTAELEEARHALERLALYDPLTGLANRTLLAERLRGGLDGVERGTRPPTVLLLDLDGFKSVNDSFGHPVGDRLLAEVARRLSAVVRAGDTVARMGGDEFALLLLDLPPADALRLACRIASAVAEPVRVGPHTCWVSASIGVRVAGPGEQPDTLIRDADTAMYAAKARGRGSVAMYEPAMHAAAAARLALTTDLRAAISAGRLELRYQPIVELDGGRVRGVEALLRWRHPTRGLLTPTEFIAAAEEDGLVTALDRWVLDTALDQLARWRRTAPAGRPVDLHVNISPVDLRAPRFAEDVVARLAHHGVAGSDLTLEVTETQLLGEDAATSHALGVLRHAGVAIAIDDFGVGYSSLGYFRRLSTDVVKIDRSLVVDLDTDPDQHRIAAAILAVVDAFGAVAVAEGVETDGQAAALRSLGCRLGQGFHLGRPMDADAVATRLALVGSTPGQVRNSW